MKRAVFLTLLFIVCIFAFSVGGTIYEPEDPKDCSEEELKKFWAEVFYEGSEGIEINSSSADDLPSKSGCASFFLYKEAGEEKYFISVRDVWFTADLKSVVAGHLKGTDLSKEEIKEGLGSFEFLENLEEREVNSSDNAKEVFENLFRHSGNDWEFVESESFADYYLLEEGKENLTYSEAMTGKVYVSKSMEIWAYDSVDSGELAFGQTKNISDFKFGIISEWKFAFNINDYFYGGDRYSCSFMNRAELVDCKVEKDGDVFFKSGEGYTGTVGFRIKAESDSYGTAYTNAFKITIVEKNEKPKYLGGLSKLVVPRDSLKLVVDLTKYFEDDGELTYKINWVKNASVSFVDDKMIIVWDGKYSGIEKVRLYADDGETEIASEDFYISVEKGINDEETVETVEKDEENQTKVLENEENLWKFVKEDWFIWTIIGIGGVIVLIFVIFIIYIGFFGKKEVVEEKDSMEVEKYLQKLSEI